MKLTEADETFRKFTIHDGGQYPRDYCVAADLLNPMNCGCNKCEALKQEWKARKEQTYHLITQNGWSLQDWYGECQERFGDPV